MKFYAANLGGGEYEVGVSFWPKKDKDCWGIVVNFELWHFLVGIEYYRGLKRIVINLGFVAFCIDLPRFQEK